jgi:hypothetical protein
LKHPSGKPVNKTDVKKLSVFRGVQDGSVIPRIQQAKKEPIGFVSVIKVDATRS